VRPDSFAQTWSLFDTPHGHRPGRQGRLPIRARCAACRSPRSTIYRSTSRRCKSVTHISSLCVTYVSFDKIAAPTLSTTTVTIPSGTQRPSDHRSTRCEIRYRPCPPIPGHAQRRNDTAAHHARNCPRRLCLPIPGAIRMRSDLRPALCEIRCRPCRQKREGRMCVPIKKTLTGVRETV